MSGFLVTAILREPVGSAMRLGRRVRRAAVAVGGCLCEFHTPECENAHITRQKKGP
jgi:hypothetical protein